MAFYTQKHVTYVYIRDFRFLLEIFAESSKESISVEVRHGNKIYVTICGTEYIQPLHKSIIKANFWFCPTLLQPMHCIESSNSVVICKLYCSVLAVIDDLALSYLFFNIFGIKYCTL